jgi:3-phosphoshikimate 1-carboxyvinyltransferase
MISICKNNVDFPTFKQISLPLSKSISNRVLILNFLISQAHELACVSSADDTKLLQEKLIQIKENYFSDDFLEINIENAGTAMRFLTSALAISKGNYILKGNERMHQRPIGDLVEALILLGADITYLGKNGFPPLQIKGKKLINNEIEIRADISSQFVSSLLLISGFLEKGLIIHLKGNVSSKPYILMTLKLLEKCGCDYLFENNCIKVYHNKYPKLISSSETDWSSSAFWYQMVSFSDNLSVKLLNLSKNDTQGDMVVADIFESFGVKTHFEYDGILISKTRQIANIVEFDFGNFPDLAQTVAVTAAALGVTAKLSGLDSLKIKETDRLMALFTELKKMNADIEIINNNSLIINPSKIKITETIHTYNDHRMIMSFAPLAILHNSIVIDNITDVSKSYPEFWFDTSDVFTLV